MKILNFLKTLVVIAAIIVVLFFVAPFLAGLLVPVLMWAIKALKGYNNKKEG